MSTRLFVRVSAMMVGPSSLAFCAAWASRCRRRRRRRSAWSAGGCPSVAVCAAARLCSAVWSESASSARVGVLQGEHPENLRRRLYVEDGENFLQPRNVRCRLGENQRVGRRVRQQAALLGYQRRQQTADLVHVGEFQGNELGNEGVAGAAAGRRHGALFVRFRGNRVVLDVGGRDDLDDRPLGHDGEALDFQDGQEDPVRLVEAHRRRGNKRHFATHVAIHQKVLAGQLAHQADDAQDFHVTEVQLYFVGVFRCRGRRLFIVQPRRITRVQPCEEYGAGQQQSEHAELCTNALHPHSQVRPPAASGFRR